jgi:hypothetical protein
MALSVISLSLYRSLQRQALSNSVPNAIFSVGTSVTTLSAFAYCAAGG